MPVTKALCKIDEIPDGGAIEVGIVDDRDGLRDSLMLTRRDASVRAYRNVCPHAGRRLDWAPNQFLVEDGCVICTAHGAMFLLASGECVSGPCRGAGLTVVPIEMRGDEVVLCGGE
ncbi:MAG: Rieske (2Fe-2S) protein [Proteobacteria bacterium]|uniref:Rieske (2Fe-2S) protein n=1 Tax=Rudaea sp. TaxID=2136325 RepID=UPI001D7C329F|nr:Rieske (2Fe-2S) protein [Pseudomonadota bacterium]MBS0566899.1 Rieske (2Fe-2S) protein [Pseudomonadota bacterium]